MGEDSRTIEQRLGIIESALQAQEAILKELQENTRRTKRYILWGRVMSLVYLMLIVAPIILAALYLPPLINQYSGVYRDLLNDSGSTEGNRALLDNLEQQLQLFKNQPR